MSPSTSAPGGRRTILYVGGFELPDRNAAAQRVLAVGRLFRELGYGSAFLGVDRKLRHGTRSSPRSAWRVGFQRGRLPIRRGAGLDHHLSKADYALELIRHLQADLAAVVAYNYPALALSVIQGACRRMGIPVVADATEWYSSDGGSPLFRLLKWADTTARMRWVHPRCDGVIATSRYLHRFYATRIRHVVEIPTLCDADALGAIPPAADAGNGDEVRMVYAGSPFDIRRLDRKRNCVKDRLDAVIGVLARVAARAPAFRLDVFGLTQENYLLAFPGHTDALELLAGRLIFHGRRPHADIVGWIKRADFTIFLRSESRVTLAGFPTKFAESLTAGIPVITNPLENILPYLRDGYNGFALPIEAGPEQEELLIGILSVSPERRAALRENCRSDLMLDYRSLAAPVGAFLKSVTGERA
ncbi:MAG: glycosyltransferase [Kiritimatiellia bacterium]